MAEVVTYVCAAAMNHWETMPELFADAYSLNATQVNWENSWETALESLVWCNIQKQSQSCRLHQNVPVVPAAI